MRPFIAFPSEKGGGGGGAEGSREDGRVFFLSAVHNIYSVIKFDPGVDRAGRPGGLVVALARSFLPGFVLGQS